MEVTIVNNEIYKIFMENSDRRICVIGTTCTGKSTIINSLKMNVSMSLIGVIMGEFLVSKEGIGYLINYGSQVFNLNLVISGIIILLIVSYLMYLIVSIIEKRLVKN